MLKFYVMGKGLSAKLSCTWTDLVLFTGQFKKASKFLQESIQTVRVIHGSESIEIANERRKLSEVLISAQEWKLALKVTQEAIVLFTMHYGKSHDSVRELCAAEAELKDLLRVS